VSNPCYSCTCTPTQPAAEGVARWTTLAGNTVPLCARHLEMWHANAATDPDLAPLRVRQIGAPA
jgi:hypothetical protein